MSTAPRAALAWTALACVGALAACDLFTSVKCASDDECPASLPACVDGTCQVRAAEGEGGASEGEGGASEGEGGASEGEGEGAPVSCSDDDVCAPGLCCDASVCAGAQGTCTGVAVGSCSAQRSSRDREAGAPALFAVAPATTSPCSPDGQGIHVTFDYLDRDGDMTTSDAFGPVLYVQTASSLAPFTFQSGQILSQSGDGTSGALDVVGCVDVASAQVAVWTQDTAGHLSNVVCADLH